MKINPQQKMRVILHGNRLREIMEHTYSACESSIPQITEYFSKKIKEYQFNKNLCLEYELLIEELLNKLIAAASPGATLTFEVKRHLGTISVKVTCPGKQVALECESTEDYAGQIIREYSEALRQSYSFGVNEIVFTTSYSSNEILLKNTVSLILAVLAGLLFRAFFNPTLLDWINENITLPIVLIFVRCMQTVSVPVAFFSLACFVVAIRRDFVNNKKTLRLVFHYLNSSIVSAGIGVLTWRLFLNMAPDCDMSAFKTFEDNFIGSSLKDFLTQSVSDNIIEPFLISNPIPFLINALLLGMAAGSVFGKSGETVCNILEAINELFSRIMNIIYGTIPFFLFVAVFDMIIRTDRQMFRMFGFEILCVFVAMVLQIVYYIFRLICGKVKVIDFFKKYAGLLWENLNIASNMDSYPYNKRVLARKTSLSREYLSEGLRLGVLLNMDGNCLVVSTVLMNMISSVGVEISPMKYIGIAVIMLLFSVGAPNLPGSFLLGMIILMSFVGISEELIGLVLIFEAIISKYYSFLNAAGDIVTLAIEDERFKRKKHTSSC